MQGIEFVFRGELQSAPLLKFTYPRLVYMINGKTYVSCRIDKRTGRAYSQNLTEQLRRQDVSWSAYMTTRANRGMSMVHVPHGLALVKDFVRIISVWRDSKGVTQSYGPVPELDGTSKLRIDENIILCAATRNENMGVHLEVFVPRLEIISQEPVLYGVQPKKRVELNTVPPIGLAFLGLPPDSGLEEGLGEFAWLSRTIQQELLNSL